MSNLTDIGRKLLVPALTQALPAAALYKLWPEAKSKPYTTLALLVAYEAVVALAGFIKGVWEQELRADVQKACAVGIRSLFSSTANFFHRLSPGFHRRLCRCLNQEYGLFNDRGLGLINANRLDLTQVFVELRIAPSPNPSRANPDPIASFELQGSQTIWAFLRAMKHDGVGLAIVGAPGSGKTTLLLHVLLTFATNGQWRRLVRAKVPVLLSLREHAERIASNPPPSLDQVIESHVGKHFPKLHIPNGWFEGKLNAGRCVVLLDGLDEVADEATRKQVSAWADQQIMAFSKSRFLLTARPHGYRSAPLQRANLLEVQPFDPRQVRAFTHQWYLANEVVSSGGKKTRAVRERAAKEANDLLRRLAKVSSLNALTVNPLLLTMIAMVHRYHGALPGSRVQLYAEICQVLLERWRAAKDVADPLRGDQKLAVLRPLAAHMMENQSREIGTQEAMAIVMPMLQRVGLPPAQQATFLADLQGSSGLLLERESGRWGFAHLSFQEYLTAAHWLTEPGTARDWPSLVANSWWFETLRLYAAQGDATPIVRACLDRRQVSTLALAWDCLDEAREIAPNVRQDAESCVTAALEEPCGEDWRLAAETRLSRRLSKDFSPLNDTVEIGATPITCAEYQLFLNDQLAALNPCPPDHWRSDRFVPGSSQEPIKGVRGEDARGFCAWLTERSGGGGWTYRLPTSGEIADGQVGASDRFIPWSVNDVGELTLAGLSDAAQTALVKELHMSVLGDPVLRTCGIPPEVLAVTVDFALRAGRGIALDRDRAPVLEVELNRVFARALERDFLLTSARDGDRDRAIARDLALELARALGLARDRDHNLDRARAIARDLALELARALGLDRDRDLDRALGLDRARALDRPMARLQEVNAHLAERLLGAAPVEARRILFLRDSLSILSAVGPLALRQAWKKFCADVFLFTSMLGMREALVGFRPIRLFLRQLLKREVSHVDWSALHWWFRLQILRSEGKLPAWEGIVLARERTTA